jgi:glycosyltransferase involved in cell wall biosynthesis
VTAGRGVRRVLYFGTYDRGVGRNAIVVEALEAAGIAVAECHASVWRDTGAKLAAAPLGTGAAVAAARLARAWLRLAVGHLRAPDYDVLLVGATAHPDLPLARMLSRSRRRPVAFDPLVSIVETVRDRGLAGERRLAALSALERALFRLPDRILVDSSAHAAAFARDLGVDPARMTVVPAGAPSAVRRLARPYRPGQSGLPIRVVYFGQYIPLHGVPVVLRAAAMLEGRADVAFDLVGCGQELPAALDLAQRLRLGNVRFHAAWLPLEDLVTGPIATADVCLGAFGPQPKADRVIPFKVYTGLAAGRAVVTGRTSAVAELLAADREVWTVPAADPAALAGAIAHLADRPGLRQSLAAAGQAAYDERFAPHALGATLRACLEDMADRAPGAGAGR